MKTIANSLIAAALVAATAPASADDVREVREAAPDGRIEFTAITGDFTIIGHDAGELILEGQLGEEIAELVIEGDPSNWRIELEPVEGEFKWRSGTGDTELTVYVPRGSDLELSTVSGDMTASGLSGPSLDIQSVSGGIEISEIASGEIDVQNVSGKTWARAVSTEDSEYQSVSGDIQVRGARGRIDVQAVSGRIDIEAVDVSDFESETVSGDLEAHLSPASGASLKLSSHSGALALHLNAEGTPRIRAETYSGSIDSDFGQVEKADFGPGESLRVDDGADAVDIEAKTFSGSLTIRRAD